MSIPDFLAVWLATWAVCWWPIAMVGQYIVTRRWSEDDGPWSLREFAYLGGESAFRSVRRWAPYAASFVAVAVEWAVSVGGRV